MTVTAVHVIPHDGIGGVEAAARAMARASPSDFYRLVPLAGGAIDPAVPVHQSPYRSPLDPRAWWRTARDIRRIRPEIAIFSLWKSVPTLLLARLIAPDTRFVFTLNADRAIHGVEWLVTLVAQLVADEIWTDSDATRQRRALPGAPSRAISFFLPLGDVPIDRHEIAPTFVVWARITDQKGLDRALPILAELRHGGIDATFDIYGPDGGALHALRSQAERLGISSAVRFHAPVRRTGLPAVARGATFFLMPSRKEGMGIACAEAMQLGLVPVVTPVGEMARYVVDGENGLIVDPARPRESAARIAALLETPERLAAMARAARHHWIDEIDHATSMREAICDMVAR